MDIQETYRLWMQSPYFDEETKKELSQIAADTDEIADRFYRNLEFGTGGLRGIIYIQCAKQRRAWQIISIRQTSRIKVLLLRMIPGISLPSLHKRLHCAWRQTELKPMCL